MSLTYNKKSNWPRTDPWGTIQLTLSLFGLNLIAPNVVAYRSPEADFDEFISNLYNGVSHINLQVRPDPTW